MFGKKTKKLRVDVEFLYGENESLKSRVIELERLRHDTKLEELKKKAKENGLDIVSNEYSFDTYEMDGKVYITSWVYSLSLWESKPNKPSAAVPCSAAPCIKIYSTGYLDLEEALEKLEFELDKVVKYRHTKGTTLGGELFALSPISIKETDMATKKKELKAGDKINSRTPVGDCPLCNEPTDIIDQDHDEHAPWSYYECYHCNTSWTNHFSFDYAEVDEVGSDPEEEEKANNAAELIDDLVESGVLSDETIETLKKAKEKLQ